MHSQQEVPHKYAEMEKERCKALFYLRLMFVAALMKISYKISFCGKL